MESGRPSRLTRWFERLPAFAAAAIAASAILTLVGWGWNIASLKSVLPGFVAMNPLTAITFLIGAGALVCLRYGHNRRVHLAGQLQACAAIVIGATKLTDVLGISDLGLDRLLFADRLGDTGGLPPNRMAPNTALNFVLVGSALAAMPLGRHARVSPAQLIAILPASLSLLAVLGYAFEVRQLYGVSKFIPMALNTALAFGLLSLAVLVAQPTQGVMRVLVADDAGGSLARRMIPLALLVPAGLAWIRMHAHRAGLFETEPGVSVMVFACIVLLAVFSWMNARALSRSDRERITALSELREAHRGLEGRVRERTAELQEANERLRTEAAERIRTEQALRNSEARYRLLFYGNPHPMWVYDRDSLAFLAVNEAATRLYGWSADEFLERTVRDFALGEDMVEFLPDVGDEHEDRGGSHERRHRRKDGGEIDVEVSAQPLSFAGRDAVLVLAHDVTGRKQLESQFRHAQKMEAVGRLAGGVAHDFNNLLTAILGYNQLLTSRLADNPEACQDVAEVKKAALRAAGLTRQLLAFSRQQVLEPRVLDLSAVIAELDPMLRRLLGADVDLLTSPAEGLGHVKADRGQIEQVVMNLAVNARDAMPKGGKLTIETANAVLDEMAVTGREGLSPGSYVMLAVTDSGMGMNATTRARIFEPFFTTKEIGRGTGLGLSTVHGIVKQSGGHIEVYSEPGRGSTFKVYLPRVEDPLDPILGESAPGADLRGNETILVVEDDELVRNIVTRTLRMNGYTVIEAVDRTRALEICQDCRTRSIQIDLMLSDVVMPGMSAEELSDHLRDLYPDLEVLYMSGYTDRAMSHQGQLEPGAAFLQKPFTIDALLRRIREVLGGRLDRARRKADAPFSASKHPDLPA